MAEASRGHRREELRDFAFGWWAFILVYSAEMNLSLVRPLSIAFGMALFAVLESPAIAAPRSFSATLTEPSACSLPSMTGSATLTIDDVSGAVTGTMTITGWTGPEISASGIHNKNAGDNFVGPFDGVNKSAPNATHSVTTTLNSIALPKILGGDGVIIVKSSATGCFGGALRGDLIGATAPVDAGTDAATSEPPVVDGGTTPSVDSGTTTPATDAGQTSPPSSESSDDGGCNQSDQSPATSALPFALGLAVFAFARRRTSRRRAA